MFNITEAMQSYWDKENRPKATIAEIKLIETELGINLPAPYVEFITHYGFVLFDDDFDGFDYVIKYPDRKEIHNGGIAFLRKSDKVIGCFRNMTRDSIQDGFPAIPKNYLTIGGDAGQNQILLKIDGEDAGSVWYWYENEWAWGIETNTWLGFIAKDFYEFINKLRAYEIYD